jgi:hypothetical protein
MVDPVKSGQAAPLQKRSLLPDLSLLAASILLQAGLAFFLGHAYDMRIFMATGYLVGTGQDPYVAQNLSAVFHDTSFQGITTLGYPPSWAIMLGLVYLYSYRIYANLLLYNLAIKIPIIAANICLACLVARLLNKLGAEINTARKAWIFLLFNPFLLYASSAWGQFDSIVALLSLLALYQLSEGRLVGSAVLLALAIAFKPIAMPLAPAVFVFLLGRPFRQVLLYFSIFFVCAFLFFIAPFSILKWDPTPILQNWNAHFVVGGGLSFMTFWELIKNSYRLPGAWWLAGLVWVPALGIAAYRLKPAGDGLVNILKKSTVLVLVFFLFRTWVSEPNLLLVLPMVVILTSVGEVHPRALTALWILPLVFSFFNTSIFQLLFPSLPVLMDRLLLFSNEFRTARLVLRTVVVIPWLIAGGWIVLQCFKEDRFYKHWTGSIEG